MNPPNKQSKNLKNNQKILFKMAKNLKNNMKTQSKKSQKIWNPILIANSAIQNPLIVIPS